MSWKFVPDDNFDLDQLNELKKFLESDLTSARAYLRQVQKDVRKYPTLDLTWAENAANNDIKISRGNLIKVNRALEIAEGKAPIYESDFAPSVEVVTKKKKRFRWF